MIKRVLTASAALIGAIALTGCVIIVDDDDDDDYDFAAAHAERADAKEG